MSNDLALYLSKNLLWHAMLIAAPVIIVALISGLIISIIQVVTQIQDSTISAVPKLLAVILMLMFGGEWMLRSLLEYSHDLIISIPELIHP